MKPNKIYESIIQAKNGTSIPLTCSGKTIESRYNPENDIERYFSTVEIHSNFLIILGAASGLLIEKILINHPEKFILAVENTEEDLNLLKNIPIIKELYKKKNIAFTSIENLTSAIINNYQPVFYDDIQIIEHKAWCNENISVLPNIQEQINLAINSISKDYSVQVHFGKIWMHNILNNLKLLEHQNLSFSFSTKKKTAVILAAGPSLESNIDYLKANQENFYIIATDTAFQVMQKRKIKCDCVVSLDGQFISSSHFINKVNTETLYVMDLSGNTSVARKIIKQKGKVIFFSSGHPLSNLIKNEYPEALLTLTPGGGTVTMAALDFAVHAGFTDIQILAADFSYINGKSYTSGTYLENLYNSTSSKLNPSEKQYSKLMYRTELLQIKKAVYTTEILNIYKKSLEEYCASLNLQLKKDGDIYKLINNQTSSIIIKTSGINSSKWLSETFKKGINTNKSFLKDLSNEDISLLPLMSYIKNHDNKSKVNFNHLLDLAYNFLERYY